MLILEAKQTIEPQLQEPLIKPKQDPSKNNTDWLKTIAAEAIEENQALDPIDPPKRIILESAPPPIMQQQTEQSSGNPMDQDVFGGVLKAMWPMIQTHVHNTVLKEVEKTVAVSLEYVSLIDFFRFTKSALGTKQPKLKNFRLIESDKSDKTIVIQLDVEYDGDCAFEMEIGTKIANIPLGIKDVKFKGVMRLELKDLIPTPPLISAAVAYFIRPPEIDFDLTKTANIADHPLIGKTVRKLIIDGVSAQVVNPHRIVIPLGVPDASIYR